MFVVRFVVLSPWILLKAEMSHHPDIEARRVEPEMMKNM
jgi:hypothetical protein